MHVFVIAALRRWVWRTSRRLLLWNAYFSADLVLFGLAGEVPAHSTTVAPFPLTGSSEWRVGAPRCRHIRDCVSDDRAVWSLR